MERTIRYKKGINGALKRSAKETVLLRTGWEVVREEDVKAYNGAKGCLLFLLFPPLALLGGSKYVDVTYKKR